jgi:hypothetical protein
MLYPGARRAWVVSASPRCHFLGGKGPRERDIIPVLQEAGRTSGPVEKGSESLSSPVFEPMFHYIYLINTMRIINTLAPWMCHLKLKKKKPSFTNVSQETTTAPSLETD